MLMFVSVGFVEAHPDHDLQSANLVLYKWANGLTTNNRPLLEQTLAEDFVSTMTLRVGKRPMTQERFFEWVPTFRSVSFDHASYNVSNGQVVVSSIIGKLNLAWVDMSVSLSKGETNWEINSVDISFWLPSDLAHKVEPEKLPEDFPTEPIVISLSDADTGMPVYARVHIADEHSEYWPPRGHQKVIPTRLNEAVGGDVQLGDQTYAYVKPEFTADLPPGKYQITAAKGMEYIPVSASFSIEGGKKNKALDLQISRWANMEAKGWYAGDNHTHFLNDYNALLEIEAEGLNVINVLATKWGQLITQVNNITGAPSSVSRPRRIVYYNEESRHRFLGHLILHPLKEPIYPLSWGGAFDGVRDGLDYPPLSHVADQAHAQGGIVSFPHFGMIAGELAIAVALGKIDSAEVVLGGNSFVSSRLAHAGEELPGPVLYWYMFLNTGFHLPLSAGTDKMHNTEIVGATRTYAYLGDTELTYPAWADAMAQGRTFTTTGPLLSFTANGQPIGSSLELEADEEVILEAEVHAPPRRFPWERFEIVYNGEVIASTVNDGNKYKVSLSAKVNIKKSGWFAARAYVPEESTTPRLAAVDGAGSGAQAHTSPIYVSIPGSRVWSEEDAAFMAAQCDIAIDWARNRAIYHTAAQRQEVIALYERAKSIYTAQ
jgi:hypothetical protein